MQILGYSEVELLSISINKILVDGKFILNDSISCYYFENAICSKEKKTIKFKWRLIPFVNDGAYAFVGWRI